MRSYQELNNLFIEAVRRQSIPTFIRNLETGLNKNTQDPMLWLFLARAHDTEGNVNDAVSEYMHFLKIAEKNSHFFLIYVEEIRNFGTRRNAEALLSTLEKVTQDQNLTPKIQKHAKGEEDKKTGPNKAHQNDKESKKTVEQKIDLLSNTIESVTILNLAKTAFNKGELEKSLDLFMKAHELGDKSFQLFFMLSQTLQRLKRFDEAQQYIDKGIRMYSGEQKSALLNLKAQIYSSQKNWSEAVDAYERLLKDEKRPAMSRFARIQLANIYRRQGDIEKAKATIDQVISDFPQDQVALNFRAAISAKPVEKGETKLDEESEIGPVDTSELEVDLSDEGIELISPMLRRDLEMAEFRDEKILRQGGHPEIEDAQRLLEKAESAKGAEFEERYPEFLEAAKAYSELAELPYYLIEQYYRALARYAMLKGGALASELRRRIFSGKLELIELGRIRDSANSYYLESLSLQVRTNPTYTIIAITNLLRAQVAYSIVKAGNQVPTDLFSYKLFRLFQLCNEDKTTALTKVAYETVVALGAASSFAWNQLLNLKGGPSSLFYLLDTPKKRETPFKVLSQITGKDFHIKQKPGEVLKLAFLERRVMTQELLRFLNSIVQTPLRVENLNGLNTKWKNFPHRSIVLDTDRENLEGISAVLATLLPYQSRSPEERTGILFTARTNIENLLRGIQDNPTYWGCIGFEPILVRWQADIRTIEQQRLTEIQPRLSVRLDPPVFYLKENIVEGGILITNDGKGTAEGAVIRVQLRTMNDQRVLFETEDSIKDEISVNGTRYFPIILPLYALEDRIDAPYRIVIEIAPIFRQITLDFEKQEFTFEVKSKVKISLEDIPWNEIRIPPKHLFKGREKFIETLVGHLRSPERNKTYVLYGLTRTGKSSILRYLAQRIDLEEFSQNNQSFRFITFDWNLVNANSQSNAKDMWSYLLHENIIIKLQQLVTQGKLNPSNIPYIKHPDGMRFKDWEPILKHLRQQCLYPVFLIDEFSFYRNLVDSKRIDASFLAAIRQFAIDGQASFVFAGTYDLRSLIRDPAYGITGQLVNAIETKVSRIEREPAVELIQAMQPQLKFTPDAIDYILHLSYRIPYFIQLICKHSAIYAVNIERGILGFPEVENVVQGLTGENLNMETYGIPQLAPGVFMNNMQTPIDPPEYNALITSICHLTFDKLTPRMVTYPEIQGIWDRHKIRYFQAKLANAIRELKDREVLEEGEDEGITAYRITVDLFRRWWAFEHKNIGLELDAVQQEL